MPKKAVSQIRKILKDELCADEVNEYLDTIEEHLDSQENKDSRIRELEDRVEELENEAEENDENPDFEEYNIGPDVLYIALRDGNMEIKARLETFITRLKQHFGQLPKP